MCVRDRVCERERGTLRYIVEESRHHLKWKKNFLLNFFFDNETNLVLIGRNQFSGFQKFMDGGCCSISSRISQVLVTWVQIPKIETGLLSFPLNIFPSKIFLKIGAS